ncbi:MAG: hypothetical protein CVT62_01735 [Actinobacteria bacterium HGW-Actinobacteria-2]|nr:MAG: hypothetical protein CVT62_01735 [Actinobacteria bacterium HGW-Actinobacteria-2]
MTSAAIRLRQPLAALWRAEGVLQVGLAEPVVIEPVPAAAQQLVELLATPHTRGQLIDRLPAMSPEWIDWLCGQLEHAGLLVGPPIPVAEVAIWGTGPLAQRLLTRLIACGLPASRLSPEAVGSLHRGRLVVLAGEQCEPDRALTTQLTRAQQSHLVVRLEPERAVVGPLVVPGDSSCVRCSDLQLCAHDDAWPRLLAQLCAQRTTPDPLLLDWATTTAVTQIAAWSDRRRPEVQGRTLELGRAELRLRARTIPIHPDCGCLS